MPIAIVLGSIYRDPITYFEGAVTAVNVVFADPTPQVRLERADKDGKPVAEWFGLSRLQLLTAAESGTVVQVHHTDEVA